MAATIKINTGGGGFSSTGTAYGAHSTVINNSAGASASGAPGTITVNPADLGALIRALGALKGALIDARAARSSEYEQEVSALEERLKAERQVPRGTIQTLFGGIKAIAEFSGPVLEAATEVTRLLGV